MPIVTAASAWRCTCGADIKAVTQRDQADEMVYQAAACPQCGEEHMVHGKIVCVTNDTSNTLGV
jgi:hypothetical protein